MPSHHTSPDKLHVSTCQQALRAMCAQFLLVAMSLGSRLIAGVTAGPDQTSVLTPTTAASPCCASGVSIPRPAIPVNDSVCTVVTRVSGFL